LEKYNKGEKTKVMIIRDGKELEFNVTF
jgi:hypothetical protein